MTSLTFFLDRKSSETLHKQLINKLKENILGGNVSKGEKLPSSRELAINLKVSRIVTLAAYEQLIAEGYLVSKAGSGTFISSNIPETTNNGIKKYLGPDWFEPSPKTVDASNNSTQNSLYDFSIGRPALSLLPIDSWKRSWRKALTIPFDNNRTDPAGVYFLRKEIASYLNRARNIKCHADDIIITSGVAESLRLIAKATDQFSPTTYAEFPGFAIAWHFLSLGKRTIRPLSIDKNGLITDKLPKTTNHPHMLFCTPSHQFPLGYRLSLKRRNQILKWAAFNDGLILEDDYDSEFHYDTMPLPTLKSQDKKGNVLYFSSFSKSISPNVKIGYLIAPQNIREKITAIIQKEHAEPTFLMQNAMAHFIAQGSLDKHIARSRRYYAKLNKIMKDELSNLPAGIKLSGLDSGIHCFLSFQKSPDQLIKNLMEKSFHVPLLPHITEIRTNPHGFALGYGHFEANHLRRSIKILKSEIEKLYAEL